MWCAACIKENIADSHKRYLKKNKQAVAEWKQQYTNQGIEAIEKIVHTLIIYTVTMCKQKTVNNRHYRTSNMFNTIIS